MRHEPNKTTLSKWRVALAALLAIASSQLVFAAHQFEHDLGSLEETCIVCIQIEQFDQATSVVPAALMPALAPVATRLGTGLLVATASRTAYFTRAPPLF